MCAGRQDVRDGARCAHGTLYWKEDNVKLYIHFCLYLTNILYEDGGMVSQMH